MKTFLRTLVFLFILAIGIAGIAAYWTFYRPLPDYNTTLNQPELDRQVDIHWDTDGVPHIFARNKADAYFSLGYVHAQDRIWQMTLSQIAAEGRFSEFLGKEMISYDKLQRTIGFWRTAVKIEQTLSDSVRNYLEAYAAGVNAYTARNSKNLPIQFSLVDMKPIPWTVTHSVAMARLMAWELNMAWKSELSYAALAEKLTPQQFRELFPEDRFLSGKFNDQMIESGWAKELLPLVDHDEKLSELLGRKGNHAGSNAWAVNASKSETDMPILAGDPHLSLDIPGKWYEVHLNVNGKNLSGATIAGTPVVVLGQNDHLAWSMTNLMLDDTDFFEEAVNPANHNQYVLDSLAGEPLYEDFEIQQEVINVKNANDTVFTRRLSKHGPIISDIYPEQDLTENRLIAMKWTGHEVSNEMDALMGMNWAQSIDQFRESGQNFKVPGQNFIYADKEDNIALFTFANVPIRDANPVTLRQGWNPAHDWQSFVPPRELPAIVNPSGGWVINANNPPVRNYPYYLSIYWEPDSRYDRIRQYLTEFNQLSPTIFQHMQLDSYSMYSSEINELILPVLKRAEDRNFETVISYLENWDFSYAESETAASIMDVFLLKLSENIFKDEMSEPVYRNFIRFSAMPARTLKRMLQDGSSFFDDVSTSDRSESQDDIIHQSMEDAIRYLRGRYGNEPFEWRWEQLHNLTLTPPLFGTAAEDSEAPGSLKLIVNNLLNKGPYSIRGNHTSINKGEYRWDEPFDMVVGPSIRRIIDFSDLSKTLSILPTGQSENPLSQYYGNQTDSWIDGQYKFLYQDSTFFLENQFNTMKLIPEK